MWGPLKRTRRKRGFRVRRQAEKQQTVYRLILLCAQELVVVSCKAPHPNPLSYRLTFLEFLASNVGIFLQQELICLVPHPPPPLRNPVNAPTIICVFWHSAFVSLSSLSPPLWQTLCLRVTGDNSQNPADFFLARISELHLGELTVFVLGRDPNSPGALEPGWRDLSSVGRACRKWPDNHCGGGWMRAGRWGGGGVGVTVIDVPDRASLSLYADICQSQHLVRFSLTGQLWSQARYQCWQVIDD